MTDELIGKIVGGYEILNRIGSGGMATVYLARQQSMNRQVALKVLPRQFMNDDTYLQRFEREVNIVSQLEHRNIVPVYDHGEHEGQPYIVMRYMPAGSIDDLLAQGPMAPDLILHIMEQIAPALDYAHSKDVLHRDLKPSNVLMDDGGGAFITDFGIARVVSDNNPGITTQGVVGTPSYMSPEQAQGKELDGRSDVYALGVMLFEMATGRRPFESDTPYSIAVLQVTQPPPMPRKINPQISTSVESVILKALKKQREDRYQTAVHLTEALKLAIEHPRVGHDTEPSLKMLKLPQSQGVQPAPSGSHALYQTPPSAVNRVVPPSGNLRSRIRQRRKQNPMISALIGGTIGCGMLGIFLAALFLALSFLLPGGTETPPAPTASAPAAADHTDAPSTDDITNTPAASTSTLTLDATSFAARQTLIARSTDSSPVPTAAQEALTIPTTGIDPVGVRTTPHLRAPLNDAEGVLVFADVRGENRTLQIVTLNLRTWIETQLTDMPNANASYPLASPDGRWVVFQSDQDGDYDIYIVNRLGGQLQKLTFNDYVDRLPSWSPDGEWVVYSSDSEGTGTYEIRRVRLDGGGDEMVFSNGQRLSHPRYSPDGQYLVFTVGTDPRNAATWEIGLLDLESGEMTLLTNNEVRDASPVFSPNGQTILYITFDGEDNALAAMSLDGGSKHILYDSSGSDWAASYSPDGQFIVFTSNITGDDQLYLVSASGGEAQAITSGGGLYGSWIPTP